MADGCMSLEIEIQGSHGINAQVLILFLLNSRRKLPLSAVQAGTEPECVQARDEEWATRKWPELLWGGKKSSIFKCCCIVTVHSCSESITINTSFLVRAATLKPNYRMKPYLLLVFRAAVKNVTSEQRLLVEGNLETKNIFTTDSEYNQPSKHNLGLHESDSHR